MSYQVALLYDSPLFLKCIQKTLKRHKYIYNQFCRSILSSLLTKSQQSACLNRVKVAGGRGIIT